MGLYLNRYGESAKFFHRNVERVYCIDDEWFFTIRRGYDQGPYETEARARQALASFIQEQLHFESRLMGMKTNSL
jgi:hypothetical protein